MTLTLDIPPAIERQEPGRQERLERAAVALYDARLVTQGQAAALAGLGRAAFLEVLIRAGVSPIQYDSAEEILAEVQTLAGRS